MIIKFAHCRSPARLRISSAALMATALRELRAPLSYRLSNLTLISQFPGAAMFPDLYEELL